MRMPPETKKPRTKKAPHCPECGATSVIPVVHGILTPALQRAVEEGKAIVSDREEWEGMTEWYCTVCGCDWGDHWRRFKKHGGVNATR
jgi:hypothetical protein